jgi:hypothetical protein
VPNSEVNSIRHDTLPSDNPSDIRQKCHLRFLALGAAFASSGKWQTAQAHAKRAISIIERSRRPELNSGITVKRGSGSNMTGREAYFLDANCYKMRAESVRDLLPARQQLLRSYRAFGEDLAKEEKGVRKDHSLISLRYLNEVVSIYLSAYYLTRSACGRSDGEGVKECNGCDHCKSRADVLFKKADLLFESAYYNAFELAFEKPSELQPELTHLNVAANVIELSTITEYWKDINKPVRGGSWDRVLKRGRTVSLACFKGNKQVIETFNSRTYQIVGKVIRDGEDQKVFPSCDAISKHFEGAAANHITVFDPWRYARLKSFLVRRCGWAE